MNYTITKNEIFNSNEITFTEKPSEAIRASLKMLKCRYNSKRKIWYGFATAEEIKKAIEEPQAPQATTKTEPKEIKNDYGVKVGDIFSYSFGYDATLYHFYQVRQLKGKKAVIVSKISPTHYDQGANSCCDWYWTLKNDGTIYADDERYSEECNIIKIVHKPSWSQCPIITFDNSYYTAYLMCKGTHKISEDNYH